MTEKSFVDYQQAMDYLLNKADDADDFGLLLEAGVRYVNNRYHVWLIEDIDEEDVMFEDENYYVKEID